MTGTRLSLIRTRVLATALAVAVCGGVAAVGGPAGVPEPIAQQTAHAAGADRRPAARFALDGPRGTTVLRNRRFGPFGPRLDVYRRTGLSAPAPAVLLVHGGGWAGDGRGRMQPVALALARAGMVAVNVSYSLAAPGFAGYPRQPRELRAAVRWIRRNAGRLGVDRRRIGAFGSSAGGHLAALLATRGRASGGVRLDAAVLWSAPLDLPALAGHRLLGPAVTNLVGCPVATCSERWAEASPLNHVSRGDAPLLIVNSRQEMVPVAQAEQMASRLAAAGVDHELRLLNGRAHGREYSGRVLRRSIAFLEERLRR